MKKILMLLSCLTLCLCGCNTTNDKVTINESEEQSIVQSQVNNIQEVAKPTGEKVSIPTTINEDGQLDDFVSIKVNDISVQRDKVTGVNQEALSYAPSAFVSSDGTLEKDRIFVLVNIDFINENEKNLQFTTTSFLLYGTTESDYLSYECFYQDNLEAVSDIKSSGMISLSSSETKNVSLGFFVTPDFFTSISYYINPNYFEPNPDLDIEKNYIILPDLSEE